MHIPYEINRIFEHFFAIQISHDNKLLPSEKDELVNAMIKAYTDLSDEEKIDILIPARSNYLYDTAIYKDVTSSMNVVYSFLYKWPTNEFNGDWEEVTLCPGEKYDRIGSSDGRYLCPLDSDERPQSFSLRAIPYYVPEDDIRTNPSYHLYQVAKEYRGDEYCHIKKGKISQAFCTNPPDGGGIQVVLPVLISSLIENEGNGGVFIEL